MPPHTPGHLRDVLGQRAALGRPRLCPEDDHARARPADSRQQGLGGQGGTEHAYRQSLLVERGGEGLQRQGVNVTGDTGEDHRIRSGCFIRDDLAAVQGTGDVPRQQVLHLDVPLARALPLPPDGSQCGHENLCPGLYEAVPGDHGLQDPVHRLRVQTQRRSGEPFALHPGVSPSQPASGPVVWSGAPSCRWGPTSGWGAGHPFCTRTSTLRRGGRFGGGHAGGFSRRHARVRESAHALEERQIRAAPPAVSATLMGGGPDAVPPVP